MSKKSLRNGREKNGDRDPPAILRRKRKAEHDLETYHVLHSSNGGQKRELSSCSSLESDHENDKVAEDEENFVHEFDVKNFRSFAKFVAMNNLSPLPKIDWAEDKDIWNHMTNKENIYIHDHTMFSKHPEIQSQMRAILLDWLIEVCEVYRLHRETFYLAQDYIDRYLNTMCNVKKQHLQLLGITSLFIASKIEEIYPPKLAEFAFVTDGACTEKEILEKELIILMTLNWNLTPITINCWLNIFLQIAAHRENKNNSLEAQGFSGHVFVQICQLLDLCILDVTSLQFPYSVLVTAALAHMVSKDLALSVSGFKWIDIAACVRWMKPFVETIAANGGTQLQIFHTVTSSDMHNIQTHNVGLKLLDQAKFRQSEQCDNTPSNSDSLGILTPPQSNKKISFKKVTS